MCEYLMSTGKRLKETGVDALLVRYYHSWPELERIMKTWEFIQLEAPQ
jgi:hypothetical protein